MTTEAWITAAFAAIGILGQLWIGGRNEGKREGELSALRQRVGKVEHTLGSHERLLTKQQARLASIASKCKVLFGPAKWGNGDAGSSEG